jgi:hypothetical protein
LLKNPWNLSALEAERLAMIQKDTRRLYRAYLLKSSLSDILDRRQVDVVCEKPDQYSQGAFTCWQVYSFAIDERVGGGKWHMGAYSTAGAMRQQRPLFLRSSTLEEPTDSDRLYRGIVRWEGVVRHMYLDTHDPPS